MKVIDVSQGEPEWFAARLGRPTGSVYSDVLAKGKDGGKNQIQRVLKKLEKLDVVAAAPAQGVMI